MRRVDPVERILNLLTLLHESPRPLTRAEIVERMARGSTPYPTDPDALHQLFANDRRTISNDLGVRINQRPAGGDQAGQTEYWVESVDLAFPELELDEEERLVLSLSLGALSRSDPFAGEALLKIGDSPLGRVELDLDLGVEVPRPVVHLIEACRRAQLVRLVDRGGGRLVSPAAVVFSRGSWFCVGTDGGEDMTLRVERIDREATVVTMVRDAESVARPVRLDAARIQELVRGSGAGGDTAVVEVDVPTAVRAGLSDRVIDSEEYDDRVLLRVSVGDPVVFRHWLFALGDGARVLGPEDLRRSVVDWLTAMAEAPVADRSVPPRPPRAGRTSGPEPAAQRLHRLLAIVPWLYRQRSVPVAEIAARVGASVDQVVRDLTLASMCGVPPYTTDALYGFWVDTDPDDGQSVVNVLHANFLVDTVRLSPRQAAAVSVALAGVDALGGDEVAAARRLRDKLDTAFGDAAVHVDLDAPLHLSDLRAAVQRGERTRIEYVDLDDVVTTREIDPLRVFIDRGHSYVIADDRLRGAERVFRVDRILSVAGTGEWFEPRPVTAPAGQSWEWMVPDREVVVVVPAGNEWVIDRYATTASMIDDDGSLVIWLSVVSDRWLESLLLRCGPGTAVLAPEDSRDLVAATARTVLARYSRP